MKIIQTRIRIIDNYLDGVINEGDHFFVALTDPQAFQQRLTQAGFPANLQPGQQFLPAIVGKVSRFNSEGGATIHRNRPKETVYRQAQITDWHYNTHIVDIRYKRYPRTPIPPPGEELRVVVGADGSLLIVSTQLVRNNQSSNRIKHIINLFLELFGECDILQQNLLPAFNVAVTRLNWSILPQGNYPWAVLRNNVNQIINAAPQHRRAIIQNRIQTISNHNPNFVAIGRAGFAGYMVFGFNNKNFFVLESTKTGNATYVLGQNWAQISQMTKQEILDQNLHVNRYVHGQGWAQQIDGLLS